MRFVELVILDVGLGVPTKLFTHSFIFLKIYLWSASCMPSAVMGIGGKNGEQKGCGPYSWSTTGNRDVTYSVCING